MLQNLDTFEWFEQYHREVCLLEIARGFTFVEFCKSLDAPISICRSCSVYSVIVKETSSGPSFDSSMNSSWGLGSTDTTDFEAMVDKDLRDGYGVDVPYVVVLCGGEEVSFHVGLPLDLVENCPHICHGCI